MSSSPSLIWFITGTSSGFGYRLATIALSRGDRVLATARSPTKLQKLVDTVSQDPDQTKKDRLKTFRLDLGDSEETIQDTVREAANVWGRIDVLINNAGTIFLRGCIYVSFINKAMNPRLGWCGVHRRIRVMTLFPSTYV
jgi:NAD(P)-dependent dehydrogenase (short-subunit alcohol dehydrogenase family)